MLYDTNKHIAYNNNKKTEHQQYILYNTILNWEMFGSCLLLFRSRILYNFIKLQEVISKWSYNIYFVLYFIRLYLSFIWYDKIFATYKVIYALEEMNYTPSEIKVNERKICA